MFRAILLAAAGVPAIAHAQEATPSEEAIPAEEEALPADEEALPAEAAAEAEGAEIVVTAGKREQSLSEIPVAVAVVVGETIDRAAIRDLKDLSTLVPSLRVGQQQSSANTNFIIRGFGNGANNAGIEPSVGVFVDGVYRSRSAAAIADLPDVKRVEVLRGPQSTLFGKNASAGVISLVTQPPQFTFGGTVEAGYGERDALMLKAALTGPVSQKIALSLAGGFNRRDGYVSDLATGADVNDRNRWFVRGQALIEPSFRTRIRLIADFDRIDETCCAVVNLQRSSATLALETLGGRINSPADRFAGVVYNNFNSSNRITNWGASGQVDYELGPVRLTSITAWRESEAQTNQDSDFTSADLLGRNSQDLSVRTFTQEVRAATSFNFPVQVVLGAFYFRESVDQANQLAFGNQFRPYADLLIRAATGNAQNVAALETALGRPTGSFFAAGTGTDEAYALTNSSYSIFGQVDYDLTDKLTLTGGLAYTHDSKRFAARVTSSDAFAAIVLPAPLAALRPFQFVPPFLGVPNAVEPGRVADGKMTYTLRLAYDLSDRVRFYAGYSTGFKASSVNLSRDSRPLFGDAATLGGAGLLQPNQTYGSRLAGPEVAKLYEAGIKADWGAVSANLAAFHQVIEGFQSNLFTGTGFVLANAGRQSVDGFELDANVRPVAPLTISLALTYLDPEYDSFVVSSLGDLSGTRPAGIPALSATFGLQYEHRMANADSLVLRGDFHYESPVAIVEGLPAFLAAGGTAGAIAAARPFEREVSELNISLSWISHSGLELSLWARNLLDDRHLISIFDSPAQTGSISGYPNQPRTMGVTARYRF